MIRLPKRKSIRSSRPPLRYRDWPLTLTRRLFSAGASDPAIKVWDVASEKSIFELRHYSNPNATVAVSRDGQLIASAGRDQSGPYW